MMVRHAFLLILSLLVLTGCAPTSLQGSAVIIEATRQFSTPFHSVVLQNAGELTLTTEGTPGTMTIKGDDNLIDALLVTINAGVLTIDYDTALPVVPSRPFLITLSVGELQQLTLDHPGGFMDLATPLATDALRVTLVGDGYINLEQVTVERLTVRLTGSGSVYAAGEVQEQDVSVSGAGAFYTADELRSQRALVELAGPVNARVWVTDLLEPTLSDDAKMFYFGSPLVRAEDDPIGLVDLGKK